MTYTRNFTPDELAEIKKQRAEMRARLTCPDADYDAVCAATYAAQLARRDSVTVTRRAETEGLGS